MNEPSGLFDEIFSSMIAGSIRTCACGRTTFNPDGGWDWEEGELENLHAQAKADPEKFREVDYSVGTYDFGDGEIVIGCPCGRAVVMEQFLIAEAERIATYIRRRHEKIIERSKRIVKELGGSK
jgi:hypothetical protein